MKIVTSYRSPNITNLPIKVEFVVLHYTAGTLKRTLEIFMDKEREVSAHLVIDLDGAVYEIVPCLAGETLRAWHAGKSRLDVNTEGTVRHVEGFNDCSIGIEMVNINGNIFPYTEAQYSALFSVIERLKALYEPLRRPEAVVGHEQIAGFRGKCDPGRCFEWDRLFSVCYPNQGAPVREAVCSAEVAEGLRRVVQAAGVSVAGATGVTSGASGVDDSFFNALSYLCEASMSKDKA